MATVAGVRIRNNRGPLSRWGKRATLRSFQNAWSTNCQLKVPLWSFRSTGSNPVRALHFSILQYNTCNLDLQANLLCITD